MKIRLLLCFLLLCSVAQAQTDELRAAYEAFRKQARQEYANFRERANKEYADFVRKAWKEYQAAPVIPKPKDDPKPPVTIKDEDKKKPVEDNPVVIEKEITPPEPKPQPQPVEPINEQPVAPIEEQQEPVIDNPQPVAETVRFSLYGTGMQVRAGKELKFRLPDTEGESVATVWERMASPAYNNLIVDCLELRRKYSLCDWAYLRMLDTITGELLGKGTNEAELMKAFLFCQSGYQMRLAHENKRLRMLYASEYHIFGKSCWDVGGTLFYADDIQSNRIAICDATFPHEQAMSLRITAEQALAQKPSQTRTLQSEDVDWMKATVAEDDNLMAFCNDYPSSYFGDDIMTRWAIYANTPMSRKVQDTLYPQLRQWITGRSKAEAVDVLCHWVQTAFVYEYDDKVWGGDRAFFPDETLYYPYCDCEDRSILLTRLVRDLLGLRCALVYYPGHLATAIAVGEEEKGDFIRISGTKYIVCDPTYIGAPIGMTMPEMDNQTAKVIVL